MVKRIFEKIRQFRFWLIIGIIFIAICTILQIIFSQHPMKQIYSLILLCIYLILYYYVIKKLYSNEYVDFSLKVLGTQSPYNTEGHNCPGFLVQDGNYNILLDCGSGSHSLLNYPSDLNNLFVIITHLHRDHYNDIFCVQYASFVFNNQKRIKRRVVICLPNTPDTIFKDIVSEPNAYAEYRIIDEMKTFKVGDTTITFCRTDHPVETYAVKLEKKNKKIVYTSDTSYSAKDRLIEFAKDADLLICESSLLVEHGFPEINSHLTAKQAAKIARQANVKKLGLTHFWLEENVNKYIKEAKRYFKNVVALREGQIIDILE